MCKSRRLLVVSPNFLCFSPGFLFLTICCMIIIHSVSLETGRRFACATCSVSFIPSCCFISNKDQVIVTIDRSVAIWFERYLYRFSVVTAHGIVEHEHSLIGVCGRMSPLSLFFHEITCILGDLPSGSIRDRPRIPITKGSSTLTHQLQSLTHIVRTPLTCSGDDDAAEETYHGRHVFWEHSHSMRGS
jgi:hypothetical protein